MSLSSLLSIARSALLAQQRAMEVTGHNVANAQTPGYSRQRLLLRTDAPQITPQGMVGRGVTSEGVRRSRDQFYDASYRRESGLFSQSSTLYDGLKQIEDAMGEPSDTGLSATMDKLFHSFADLANDPASPANRDLVWQSGNRLSQQLNQLDQRLSAASSDALVRVQGEAVAANDLLRQIAKLNQQILSAGGDAAPDLQDARDNAIDQLSQKLSIHVVSNADGTLSVFGEASTLVDGITATQLTVTGLGSTVTIQDDAGTVIGAPGSAMGALMEITNVRVPAVRAQLDQLANALVTQVNTLHRTGYTSGGTTNNDFFDPTGVTASSIRLTAALRTSSAAVAASGSAGAGDGTIAQKIADLASSPIGTLAGRTFRDFYSGVANDVGQAVQSSGADLDAQQTLVDAADQRRAAVSGVSVDEEMVNLVAQQQAYGAAAKLITTADEMVRVLLETI